MTEQEIVIDTQEFEHTRSYWIGIVGVGHLGSALVESSALNQTNTHITTMSRNMNRAEYDRGIHESEVILLCLKQDDLKHWLHTNAAKIAKDQILISLAAGTRFNGLDTHSNGCKIGRAMTSIRIATANDVLVWSSNSHFNDDEVRRTNAALNLLGETHYVGSRNDVAIENKMYEACGMGGLSFVLNTFIQSYVSNFGFQEDQAIDAVKSDLLAMGNAISSGMSFTQIREAVETKNGVTGKGNEAMQRTLIEAFKLRGIGMQSRTDEIAQIFEKRA